MFARRVFGTEPVDRRSAACRLISTGWHAVLLQRPNLQRALYD